MTSSNGHHEYDAQLLAEAPAPTKHMMQSGYATELLVDDDKAKPSRRGDLESGRRHKSSKHTSAANGAEPKGASTTSIPKPSPQKPFYRTRRGIIILLIVAIVLLAAIIGGAVGGTLANKKSVPIPTNGNSIVSPPASSGDVGVPPPTETGAVATPGVATSVVRSTTTVPSPASSTTSPAPRLPTIGFAFTPPA